MSSETSPTVQNHLEFREAWRLLGERLFILKSLEAMPARGLAEFFLAERERTGSKEKETVTLEEIAEITAAVQAAAELVRSAGTVMCSVAEWCDEAQAARRSEARQALQRAEPAGSA